MELGVVGAQVQPLEVARGTVRHQLHQVGPAVPDLADDGRALHLGPGVGTGQGVQPARQVGFPGSDLEIEVVLAVPFRRSRGGRAESIQERAGGRIDGHEGLA